MRSTVEPGSFPITATERKTEILEVAKRIFAERGVKQATVREIGQQAGILSGSLYHHFDSKLDMVDEILRGFCTEVLARDAAMADEWGATESIERLTSMVHYAVSLVADHRAALQIILADSTDLVAHDRFAYLVEFNATVEQRWLDVVADGVASGSMRATVDPGLFYRFARDAILGVVRWYDGGRGVGLDVISTELTAVLLRGVAVDTR